MEGGAFAERIGHTGGTAVRKKAKGSLLLRKRGQIGQGAGKSRRKHGTAGVESIHVTIHRERRSRVLYWGGMAGRRGNRKRKTT